MTTNATTIPTTTTVGRTVLRSDEFTCPSCVAKIEKKLTSLPGVTAAKVSFETGRITADHDDSVTAGQLIAAVAAAGYKARRSL